MIKILIVDDELLVRIGLKSTLRWEEHGYTLVGEAKNAKEAIELFERYNPEILLTDISMPGLTGLELIRMLRERNPFLQSIILTHYEDFHYAREAVSLGVRDYIVKSNLTPERLLKVLKESEGALSRMRGRSVPLDIHPVSPELSPDSAELEKGLNSILFQTETDVPADDRAGILAEVLPYKGYQVAVISINLNIKVNENSQLDRKQRSVIEDVSLQVLSDNPFPLVRTVHRNEIIYLFNYDSEKHPDGIDERISRYMLLLKSNLKKYLNYYLLTGLSSSSSDIRKINTLYEQARIAGKRAFFETDHISLFKESQFERQGEKIFPDDQFMLNCLNSGNTEDLFPYIENIFAHASRLKDYDYVKTLFYSFMDTVENYLTGLDTGNDGDDLKEYGIDKLHFYSLYDMDAVKMHVLNLINSLQKVSDTSQTQTNFSYIIRKSITYIDSHYNENISLNNLATNADVSRSYLSFLFKQELGVNFSFYLTQTRIRNAKDMLTSTNLKIYEIADKVGFDSPYYFSKVFKETTGITCKEFRNKYYGTM